MNEKAGGEFCVKIPICEEGLKATMELKKRGVKVLMTAIFTPAQALIAAIGSAIGIGIAGQSSIGAWKKCYMVNKAAPFILTVFAESQKYFNCNNSIDFHLVFLYYIT